MVRKEKEIKKERESERGKRGELIEIEENIKEKGWKKSGKKREGDKKRYIYIYIERERGRHTDRMCMCVREKAMKIQKKENREY